MFWVCAFCLSFPHSSRQFFSVGVNPHTYKRSHSPTVIQGMGLMDSWISFCYNISKKFRLLKIALMCSIRGRYYASEVMRDPKLQKKAINSTLDKAHPVIQKVGSEMLDQLSTKVRPNQRYKTDRPDLDGAGFDIHAAIWKLPKPKKGWTLPGHNYTGPYNPLEKQVKYDPETGEILEVYQQPLQAQQMRLQCNMMLIMMFVPTVKKSMVKILKNAKTKQIKKW